MLDSTSTWRSRTVKRLAPSMVVSMAFALAGASLSAEDRCRNVNGHFAIRAVAPTSCPSPVGLCIEGEFSGGIRGPFTVTATSFIVTADTPTTAVVLFTGDGVIRVRIGDKRGDLFLRPPERARSVGTGEIVDLQFINGGTGALTGASGVLRASGTFRPGRRYRRSRIHRYGLSSLTSWAARHPNPKADAGQWEHADRPTRPTHANR